MATGFSGVQDMLRMGRLEIEAVEYDAALVVRRAAMSMLQNLMQRTPVWSGETVRNYAVGIGTVSGAYAAPSGVPPHGPTNKMPLGPEPHRGENEAAALSAAEGLLSGYVDIRQPVFISNNIDGAKWDLVDNGGAPETSAKLRPRYPGGISIMAIQSVRAMFGGDFR